MTTTDRSVVAACARAIRELERITDGSVSNMDAFYIDTAREQLLKVIRSNGYRMSESYRISKR